MDRRVFLAGMAAALAATPASAETLFVNTNGLNVRLGPGTNFGVVATISLGTSVVVLRRTSGWANVRLPNGAIGWVSQSYLVRTRPRADPDPVRGRVLVVNAPDGALALRMAPDGNARILRQMRNGTRVTLLGQDNGPWVRVQHQSGDIGWAFRPSLRFP